MSLRDHPQTPTSSISERTRAANLKVTVGSGDALSVGQFMVQEQMSSLFSIELGVLSENANVDFDAIVGQPAAFEISPSHTGREPQQWTGLCSHLEFVSSAPGGLSTFQMTIVPTLWLLTQRRNYRIFQHESEIDIVSKILGEWGVAFEFMLQSQYAKREYRVQYAETDYNFVSRLLEDIGVSFWFRQSGGETKLVLSDAPQAQATRTEVLPYDDSPNRWDRDLVTQMRVGQRVRPGSYSVRDYDPRLPADLPIAASASAASGGAARLESFEYAPGAFSFSSEGTGDTPSADDHGSVRTDPRAGQALAARRLEAIQSSKKIVTFRTTADDLAPGVIVRIDHHPRRDLDADRPQLIVASRHEGKAADTWIHTCEARSASQPYRPEPVTQKPRVNGVESATVVGPAGEEIHTDEFGRARVHFHWDRESKMDQRSSCWIPVSQPWGGAGFGSTSLARIGQEVIVDFMGGDPDKPIIVGRVYTTHTPTPYTLPDNKTQSGWKTNSTGGGGGFNEVMFEDAVGRELVRMRAEKDLKKLVQNDEDVVIGRDRSKRVGHDDTLKVENDRAKEILRNETVRVGNDRDEQVDNDERIVIGRDRDERVAKNEKVTIGKNRKKSVGKNDDLKVGANRSQTVAKNERQIVGISRTRVVGINEMVGVGINQTIAVGVNRSVNVGGSQKTNVKKTATEKVGKTKSVTVGAACSLTVGAAYQVSVGALMNTTVTLSNTEEVGVTKSVVAGEKIEFTCGRSKIVLEKEGRITLAIEDGAALVLDDTSAFVSAAEGGVVVIQGGPNVHVNP